MQRALRKRQRIMWRRSTFVLQSVFGVVLLVLLSGCMEALQPGNASEGRTPPILPDLTLTRVPEPATTVAAEITPSETGVVPESTLAPLSTLAPSELPTPEVQLSPTAAASPLPTIAVATQPLLSNEARWRNQQIDRLVFPQMRQYRTNSSELWWFDPLNQQSIILGSFSGEFTAQASFTLRGQGVPALEVPYQINISYGLTALSPAIIERIHAAGYEQWIETYVFVTPNVTPQS